MSFERLRVYQAAERLDELIRGLVEVVPKGHSRDLDQLRRASSSVPYNIAEAYGSTSPGRRRQHLEIARASTDETRAIVRRLAARSALARKSIPKTTTLALTIAKMLTSWISKLPVK
jgi:four helix bundle protein